jgi:hypothetical protein
VSLATAEAIRDRIYALLEALTPTSLSSDKFRRYRNEDGADFPAWAEKNVAAALRRFQVRQVGDDGEPDVSNTTEETVEIDFEITLAYPQTHRYGAANGMDRDDVRKQDWKQIKHTIGIDGRGNFSSSHDCTPLGAVETLEQGGKIDYSVIRARFRYQRSTT